LQSAAKDVVLSLDLVSLRNELLVKLGNNEVLTNTNLTKTNFANITETTNSPSRKVSIGYQEENFALSRYILFYYSINRFQLFVNDKFDFFRSSTMSNLSPIESSNDPSVTDLHSLFEEITRMNDGLSLKTHRYHLRSYHSCFLGHNLIDWLLNHEKVTSR